MWGGNCNIPLTLIAGAALKSCVMVNRLQDQKTEKLTAAVDRELLFKPRLSIPVKQHTDVPSVESIATYIIAKYVDDVSGNPIPTSGDGNCLYNAISMLLFGNEALATQLSGAFSNVWHLLALSDVIMSPIRSIYPNVDGDKDGVWMYLNKIFYRKPNVYYNVKHFAAVSDVIERGINMKREQNTKRQISSSGSSACENDCFQKDDAADDDNHR
ncbi:hypothetical protein CHS0354_004439 [Potamilus streckersoni]|uniref:OTU domain-containing protein n=1 Tax=Potamilus streckersoni TaxID=2493646 RepID=A0AAE0RLT8_9BIVA|nr:hypothetical protein CHS0354_000029 [Potamilus streckersoni]KAK3592211.1 hypothetical protein CHS0354_004439 [Potamilus streckersoni]